MRLISISSRSISPSLDVLQTILLIGISLNLNAAAMRSADSKSSNSFFWLYNFEKFGDIYPTNLDNVILRNYPIMLNGIFVSTKTAFHVGHEYLIILA